MIEVPYVIEVPDTAEAVTICFCSTWITNVVPEIYEKEKGYDDISG